RAEVPKQPFALMPPLGGRVGLANVGVSLVMNQRDEPAQVPPGHRSRGDRLWRRMAASSRRRGAPRGGQPFVGERGGPDRWRSQGPRLAAGRSSTGYLIPVVEARRARQRVSRR